MAASRFIDKDARWAVSALLEAKNNDWVHARGAAGRDEARQQSDTREQDGDAGKS